MRKGDIRRSPANTNQPGGVWGCHGPEGLRSGFCFVIPEVNKDGALTQTRSLPRGESGGVVSTWDPAQLGEDTEHT